MILKEKLKATKHIILFYYAIIGATILLFHFFFPMYASMFSIFNVFSGFYGFYHHSVDDHSISNALYFTFRLYLLDFADVFTQDGSSPIRYPLLLEIARWTAASYTITTIFIAIYRTLEREISLFIAQL